MVRAEVKQGPSGFWGIAVSGSAQVTGPRVFTVMAAVSSTKLVELGCVSGWAAFDSVPKQTPYVS
jgi:hypothetical protein